MAKLKPVAVAMAVNKLVRSHVADIVNMNVYDQKPSKNVLLANNRSNRPSRRLLCYLL